MHNYSVLSLSAQALRVSLPVLRGVGELVHLLVNSTGVKLFGEGKWQVGKHGYSKRPSWRNVHIGMDGDGVAALRNAPLGHIRHVHWHTVVQAREKRKAARSCLPRSASAKCAGSRLWPSM